MRSTYHNAKEQIIGPLNTLYLCTYPNGASEPQNRIPNRMCCVVVKLIKYLPVAETHAIGYELTMMVEMLHAPVAQSAVFGP